MEVVPTPRVQTGTRGDTQTVERMVGVVRPRVVLDRVNGAAADTAVAAPGEIAEIDEEVGWHSALLEPQVFRPMHAGSDRHAAGTWERFEAAGELRAERFVVAGVDDALRLAAA